VADQNHLVAKSEKSQVKDLIKVNNLVKHFPVRGGILKRVIAWVQAVDDVIEQGVYWEGVRGINHDEHLWLPLLRVIDNLLTQFSVGAEYRKVVTGLIIVIVVTVDVLARRRSRR